MINKQLEEQKRQGIITVQKRNYLKFYFFICLSAILQVIRIQLVRHHFERKTIIRLCRPIQYWR